MSIQKIHTLEKYQAGNENAVENLEFDNPDDPHLSVTQLKMFLRCPLQYEFRYIKGLKAPPSGAMTLGKSVHSTLEDNFRQKIRTKQDYSLEYWKDCFSDKWDNLAPDTNFRDNEKPGKLKDDGIRLLGHYHENLAPGIQPRDVERKFLVPFEYVRYPLLGYMDLIDENGYIIDHKVTKRSWPKGKQDTDLQLTAYSIAYRYLEDEDEKGLRLDVMVRSKEPKIQQLYTKRYESDIERFNKLLSYVSCSIENGVFYPNENYMCPSCGYADLCREW